ncbi:TPA: hypothetical protein NJ344_000594 [Vibrio parahaemolyticus]|jgi:hypothetical protein|nr:MULTISPECIES: hypothetical protein [Vibrio]MBY7882915.1 hypothetical protein [Vibrio fluvialis]MCS0328334.1 hypothetical protein [Vibrio diabolicus]EHZ2723670.1 hypothetical protein [Vibrio parahaemolyticus]EIE1194960.1 hypothetical protein [Vibrio parahaemolyticus]EIV1596391.1 hypothetical protein [Vibrio parahaemolyticus]
MRDILRFFGGIVVSHVRVMCGSMGLVPAMFAWAMTYGAYMWTQTGIFW